MKSLAFYPPFETNADFTDQYFRMKWYLSAYLENIESITVAYLDNPPQLEEIPDYFDPALQGTSELLDSRLHYVSSDHHEALQDALDQADMIICWQQCAVTESISSVLPVHLEDSKLLHLDHNAVPEASSAYLRVAALWMDEETIVNQGKQTLEQIFREHSGPSGLIAGGKFEVEKIPGSALKNTPCIASISTVTHPEFLENIRPAVFVVEDPLYTVPLPGADALRKALMDALYQYGAYLIVPVYLYSHYRYQLPEDLQNRIVAFPHPVTDTLNQNLPHDFYVSDTESTLTSLLLPLAAALFDTIYIAGFEGSSFHEPSHLARLDTVVFTYRDVLNAYPAAYEAFEKQYRETIRVLDEQLRSIEAAGKSIVNLTPSHIPPLAARLEENRFAEIENARVLLICGVRVNDQTGGGVAMSNFFRDFAGGRVAQIHSDVHSEYSFSVVDSYFSLPPRIGRDKKSPAIIELPDRASLLQWCESFQPTIIYYQPIQFSQYFNRLAIELAFLFDVPLITHIMDNMHRLDPNPDNQALLDKEFTTLFGFSKYCLSISEEMARDYREEYDQTFVTVQQFINVDEWQDIHKDYSRVNQPFNVTYVGKLLQNFQTEALHEVAMALNTLNEQGIPTELNIYGPEHITGKYSKEICELPIAHYRGFVPDEAYTDTLLGADLLVVVADFNAKSIENTKYSMPAKIPHYLASGTAVLIYSPPGLPQNNAAKREGWGVVVEEQNPDALVQALRELIESSELREKLGRTGRKWAFEAYSDKTMKRRLNGIMENSIALHHSYRLNSVLVSDYLSQYENNAMIQIFTREDDQNIEEVRIIAQILNDLPPGSVMVDVGAHVGSSLMPFVRKSWQVYAFEPDPDNRKKLVERVGGNHFVTIDTRAVSREEGRMTFYQSEESTGISGLSAFSEGHQAIAEVEVTTLSQAAEEYDIRRVDFLKIDTEGYDLMVLQGFPWDQMLPRIVLCEFEDSKTKPLGYDYHEMARYLMSHGYRVFVSEWHPIVRYGISHQWRTLMEYPCELGDAKAWGNLIAFRDDADATTVEGAFKRALKPVKPAGPPPKSAPSAPPVVQSPAQRGAAQRAMGRIRILAQFYSRWPGLVALGIIILNVLAVLGDGLAPVWSIGSSLLLLLLLGHIATQHRRA